MARFVDLVVIEGPDRGMRYTVDEDSYRVICRAPDERSSTLQMTPDGDRALQKEQEEVVDAYFAAKSGRVRVTMKTRGPDIVLRDGSVSRTHAMVFVDADGASVVDLMSTNGCKVNGSLVRDVPLKTGDVIHVGKTHFRVDEEG